MCGGVGTGGEGRGGGVARKLQRFAYTLDVLNLNQPHLNIKAASDKNTLYFQLIHKVDLQL